MSFKEFLGLWPAGAQPLGGKGGHAPSPPPPPTLISEPNNVQQFQFQTQGILLFMGVQKLS